MSSIGNKSVAGHQATSLTPSRPVETPRDATATGLAPTAKAAAPTPAAVGASTFEPAAQTPSRLAKPAPATSTAALQALGLTQAQAQRFAAQNLTSAPVITTFSAVEDAAVDAARALRTAGVDTTALATGLVQGALAAHGPRGVVALQAALSARISDAPFLREVRLASLTAVAARVPSSPAEAIDKMWVVRDLADSGRYQLNSFSYDFFFTNEEGLGRAVADLKQTGGAAIGASGGTLDVATRMGADAVVLVDVDPRVGSFVAVVGTLLVALDQVRPDLDDAGRAAAIAALLDSRPQALALLAQAGCDGAALTSSLATLGRGSKTSGTEIWLNTPDAPARVAALSTMARQGRLLAVASDWADPRLGDTLNAVLRGLDMPVAAVNMSNLLDYTFDDGAIEETWRQLPWHAEAVVVANSFYPPEQNDFGRGPGEVLGSFRLPKVATVTTWLDDGFKRVADFKKPGTGFGGNVKPVDIDAYRTKGIADRMAALATPADARAQVANALKSYGLLDPMVAVFPDGEVALIASLPVPRTFDEIAAVARRAEAAFWTPNRREAHLDKVLKQTPENAEIRAKLLPLVRAARTAGDVNLLVGLATAAPLST